MLQKTKTNTLTANSQQQQCQKHINSDRKTLLIQSTWVLQASGGNRKWNNFKESRPFHNFPWDLISEKIWTAEKQMISWSHRQQQKHLEDTKKWWPRLGHAFCCHRLWLMIDVVIKCVKLKKIKTFSRLSLLAYVIVSCCGTNSSSEGALRVDVGCIPILMCSGKNCMFHLHQPHSCV